MANESGDSIILLFNSSGKTSKLSIQSYNLITREKGPDFEKGYANDYELPVISEDGQHLFLPSEVRISNSFFKSLSEIFVKNVCLELKRIEFKLKGFNIFSLKMTSKTNGGAPKNYLEEFHKTDSKNIVFNLHQIYGNSVSN